MGRFIKRVRNETVIEFDSGTFDDWCVYVTRQGQERYAPKDYQYFDILQGLARVHGAQKIYDDYVEFYNKTDRNILGSVLLLITNLSGGYEKDAEEIDIWFTVLYAGMVAEENKAFA